MEHAQALAIVRSLANGVDPETGEVFPPESTYQRPQVVRALYEAAGALERIERFDRRKQQMPPKTGEPWSEDEDRKLLAAFDAGRALQELAAAHEEPWAPSERGFSNTGASTLSGFPGRPAGVPGFFRSSLRGRAPNR